MNLINLGSPQKPAYNVLLIGEDPKQTEVYADLIREVADCQLDVISRVESAFDWIGRFDYHLVVIDLSVSSMNGLTMLESIKRLSPVASVLLITDNATVEEAVAAIRMGAEDYLQKPFNLEAFQLAVKRGLDRKAVFAEDSGASNFLDLLNSCQMISATLDQGRIFGILMSYFARELKADHSAIYTIAIGSDPLRVETTTREDRAMEEILDIAIHASSPLSTMTESGEFYRFVERGQLTPGLFVFRFRCAGSSDFFCVRLAPQRPGAVDALENRLRMLRAQLEVTGKNIDHYQGVQQLAYVDDATGLYNMRYLGNILDREITQSETSGKSFAILFIDADRFKNVNDSHGHLAGTKLLNELGNHLKTYVRDTDTVFRYGGDEFVAVLSNCDLPTAQAVAERIRHSVEQAEFLAHEGLHVKFTVSIGVALFPDHAQSKKAVIDTADQAMYSAKRKTRNCVFIAEAPAAAPRPPGEASG